MSALKIPEAGLDLENSRGSRSKSGAAMPTMLGLSISNAMIEEMIKCVQSGKAINLTLGDSPNIHYGNKTQHLAPSHDEIPLEVYRTNTEMAITSKMLPACFVAPTSMKLTASKKPVPKSSTQTGSTAKNSRTTSADAALAQLRNSLALEDARKENKSIKVAPGLSIPKKGSAAKGSYKTKILSQSRLGNDSSRSMPASPALSSVRSPSLNPAVPLSVQRAEQQKAARKPVIHLLALGPISKESLQRRIPDADENDFDQALDKVGDLDATSKKWTLRTKFYRELDVWTFRDYKDDERQRVIDSAIKIYDKLRITASEPEWERLLPKNERGTGKCLSKLQVHIAQNSAARTPKINVSNADKSGQNTPAGDDDLFGENGAGRSNSQPPATKTKKPTEKDAQAKRLFSKKPAKNASKASTPRNAPKTAAKSAPAKKAAPPKGTSNTNGKVLSAEFVNESDEDDDYSTPPKPAAKKAPAKRIREDEVETSDSSVPLAKKAKKETGPPHRMSEASQSSRTTNSSHSFSSAKPRNNNSPQKSSPLASSPPTNASDIEESDGHTSSSASPAFTSAKNPRSPIHSRHQKSSSVSSSGSDAPKRITKNVKNSVMDDARKYKMYYPQYVKLYHELANSTRRDKAKEDNLLDMHARLEKMKRNILENSGSLQSS